MRKQKRTDVCKKNVIIFMACVLICAAPPSVAQAAINAELLRIQQCKRKKHPRKTVTIETSGEITKKKVKRRWFCDSSCGSE